LKCLTSSRRPALALDAFILAGGQALRLGGRDKSALAIAGQRLLDRQLAALGPVATRVTIVGGTPGRFAGSGVPVVADLVAGVGPLGGIYTALSQATTARVLILACDLPFVTAPFLEYLGSAGHACDVTLPRNAHGLHPLCAAWARATLPVVGRLLDQGVRKVRDALDALRLHVVEGEALEAFDPDGRLLHNINTPDDLARAIGPRG
jgi:molybdopterin-guanine dinucleotide biosynthesis protein A